MKYKSLQPYSLKEATFKLATASAEEISEILQGLAITAEDTEWKQYLIENYICSSDINVKISAVKVIGILCRIHKSADFDRAIDILKSEADNERLIGYIEDTLEDIRMFRPE